MKIWILCTKKATKTYEMKRFVAEAKVFGCTCKLVQPEKFEIIASSERGKSVLYNGKPVKLPDVFIPRTSRNYFPLAITRQMERLGVLVLNNAHSIENARDKMASLQILSSHNLPIPKTILAKLPLDLAFVEKELQFPAILKILSGSQGRGVVLCNSKEELEDITGLVSGQDTILILQEFIAKSHGQDIRVVVVGGKIVGAMHRQATTGNFKANFSTGGEVKSYEMTPELEWLALESARLINLDVGGIDILFDEDGTYKVCEVNSFPGFEGFEKATGINIPHVIFEYAKMRLGIV